LFEVAPLEEFSCRTLCRAKLLVRSTRSLLMTAVDSLIAQAQQLSPDELELLVLRLQDRLDEFASPDMEAAWADEIERRVQAMDRSEVELIPWGQMRQQLGQP
jgi:putative addiction module component (TIGR02574 family)